MKHQLRFDMHNASVTVAHEKDTEAGMKTLELKAREKIEVYAFLYINNLYYFF